MAIIASVPSSAGFHRPGQIRLTSREQARVRRQDEAEGQAERGRGDRVGPDEHGAVDPVPAQLAVGEERQHEGEAPSRWRCVASAKMRLRTIEFQ